MRWVPWQLAPESDPDQRFILVSSEDDGIEHPDNQKFDSAEKATEYAIEYAIEHAGKNRIVRIEAVMINDNTWSVRVTKEFAEEYGGGSQTFVEQAGSMHRALDIARGMVTVSPGTRLPDGDARVLPTEICHWCNEPISGGPRCTHCGGL